MRAHEQVSRSAYSVVHGCNCSLHRATVYIQYNNLANAHSRPPAQRSILRPWKPNQRGTIKRMRARIHCSPTFCSPCNYTQRPNNTRSFNMRKAAAEIAQQITPQHNPCDYRLCFDSGFMLQNITFKATTVIATKTDAAQKPESLPHLAISLLLASRKAPIATEFERGRETYPAGRPR